MHDSASRRPLGPIELEVIHGTIRAAELEIKRQSSALHARR